MIYNNKLLLINLSYNYGRGPGKANI